MFEPPPRAVNFVGREEELRTLSRELTRHRKKVGAITGKAAIGKTALATEFLSRHERDYRSYWLAGPTQLDLDSEFYELISRIRAQRDREAIVVLDDFRASGKFDRLFDYKRVASILVTTRQTPNRYFTSDRMKRGDAFTLPLKGLNEFDAVRLLATISEKRIAVEDVDFFVKKSQGSPLALIMIAGLMKDYTIEQIKFKLDGEIHSLDLELPVAEKNIVEVIAPKIIVANEVLIRNLKERPQDLHMISPRKFEEVIAELLDDMGWDVELTPASKDGGKDIIAVMHTDIGPILSLVEAKHYRPDRPVQVGLVKQLYGTFVDHGATNAMLVTSSRFTKGAKEFQSKHKYQITLKEYADLLDWIQKYKTRKDN